MQLTVYLILPYLGKICLQKHICLYKWNISGRIPKRLTIPVTSRKGVGGGFNGGSKIKFSL